MDRPAEVTTGASLSHHFRCQYGNSDSVLIVPRGEIDAVLPGLEGTAEKEKGLEAEIATGQTCMTLVYKALA